MFSQLDERCPYHVMKFGCLHLCLLAIEEKERQKKDPSYIMPFDLVMDLIQQSIDNGWCTEKQQFLMYPQKFLDLISGTLAISKSSSPPDSEYQIELWKAEDPDELHFTLPEWDPWDDGVNNAVARGTIKKWYVVEPKVSKELESSTWIKKNDPSHIVKVCGEEAIYYRDRLTIPIGTNLFELLLKDGFEQQV